jgi:dTDP-3-amino-3,4,6-trideoxy-alpha-D-glucose transaminase
VKGHNSRLDEIQAAVLRVKLPHLADWNGRRSRVAKRYLTKLADHPDISLPSVLPHVEPVWHLFVVDLEARDAMRARLDACGIETMIHYPVPPHLSEAYASDRAWPDLPVTEEAARTHLSLPMGPHLGLDWQDRVVEALGPHP